MVYDAFHSGSELDILLICCILCPDPDPDPDDKKNQNDPKSSKQPNQINNGMKRD